MRASHRTVIVVGAVLAGTTPALAQENKFSLSAQVVGHYDDNELRRSSFLFDGPTDNSSLSPLVSIDYSRNFGRQRVFLAGNVGYVFNSRFNFLNRETVNLSGGVNLRAGARCQANPAVQIFRAQSDLEDLGAPVKNTVTVQSYQLELVCLRRVGLYPKFSGAFSKTDNSDRRRERNQEVYGGRAALVYSSPAIGGIEAFFEYSHTDRPNRVDFRDRPIVDETEITTYGIRYDRSVGTLITLVANIGQTHASPRSSAIRSFTGITYGGSLSYRRSSRASVNVGFDRSVTTGNNVGSSYFINNSVSAGISYKPTSKIGTSANVSFGKRQFRGEDPVFQPFGARGDDKSTTVSASVGYRLNRRINLTLAGRYRKRDAENEVYDYSSKQATLTASLGL